MMTVLIVTVAAWVLAQIFVDPASFAYFAGFVPGRFSTAALPGALPVWITPLSATLLHASVIHLGFNMLMLGYCGRFVEYALGARGVIILYLVGAYAAAAAHYLQAPSSVVPMVGASGAISALVGGYAMLFGQRRGVTASHPLGHWLHILWLAVAWIVVQLLVGFASAGAGMQIAIGAHIGGFIAGLLLTRPLLMWRYRNA